MGITKRIQKLSYIDSPISLPFKKRAIGSQPRLFSTDFKIVMNLLAFGYPYALTLLFGLQRAEKAFSIPESGDSLLSGAQSSMFRAHAPVSQ